MYYKKLNYPENKPEQPDEYQTDKGKLYWDGAIWNLGKDLKWHINPQPTLFYQPVSLPNGINRDEMIEVLVNTKIQLKDGSGFSILSTYEAEVLADAILKSGLPEKKDIKYPKESTYKMGSENQDHYKAWSDGYNKAIQDTKDLNNC